MRLSDVSHVPLAEVVGPEGHPNQGQAIHVLGTMLRHPNGVMLVDTGIGGGHHEVDAVFRPRRHSLEEVLASAGVQPADVVGIINCHLHFDHCGGNQLFPRVPIYVQRAEREAAREPDYTIPEWVEFPGAAYVELDGETEILPGVRVTPTPGHTRGHQSTTVQTEQGLVLLAGQAVYTLAEWEGDSDPRVSGLDSAWDREAYMDSFRRLRNMAPLRVYFGHDPLSWERP
jgi:N-acyl homoserine lactone hydrolase